MTDNTLIERLEALTAPCREVDKELCVAVLGYKHDASGSCLILPDGISRVFGWPNLTASIDAAMTLVDPTDHLTFSRGTYEKARVAILSSDDRTADFFGKAPTLAIALCIAALKSRDVT